jgi:hypothetical protein
MLIPVRPSALTLLRTWYNFCVLFRNGEEDDDSRENPEQRLGIADRRYKFKDILYFK